MSSSISSIRRSMFAVVLAVLLFLPASANADTRLIVRTTSSSTLKLMCSLLGCNVVRGLDGGANQLFLVTVPDLLNLNQAIKLVIGIPGVVAIELDQIVRTAGASANGAPPALSDRTPVNYYGTTVWHGYIAQPAYSIVGIANAQSTYKTTGTGVTVAVIDTGVDPNQPVLKSILVP